MSKPIYLFKEHQNFQAGKTKLNEAAVFDTHFVGIMIALLFSLASLWFGGKAFVLQWRYSQTGEEILAEVLSCRYTTHSKGSFTYITYQFTVNGQVYSNEDQFSKWLRCQGFAAGQTETIYYLSDEPELSRLGSFVKGDEWFYLASYGSLGLIGVLGTFVFMMENRKQQYEYHRLKHADTILEARVIEIGRMPSGKSSYDYARYEFLNPQGNTRKAELRSNLPYPWPKGIQVGDSLHILYIDDDTFCVL